jgi:putative transposase
MPWGLKRYQATGHSHFLTFSCYRRLPRFEDLFLADLFVHSLEQIRVRFGLRVYGFVVMPEHVHLLVSEPEQRTLAIALHSIKLGVAKRARGKDCTVPAGGAFWQKRYYDHYVRNYEMFVEKLRYIHRNPVTLGAGGAPARLVLEQLSALRAG